MWFRRPKSTLGPAPQPETPAAPPAVDGRPYSEIVDEFTLPEWTPAEIAKRAEDGRPVLPSDAVLRADIVDAVVTDAVILDAVDIVQDTRVCQETDDDPDEDDPASDYHIANEYNSLPSTWSPDRLHRLLEHVVKRHAQTLERLNEKQVEIDTERTRSESYNRQLVEARSRLNGLLPIKQFPMVGYHIDGRTIQIETKAELKTLTAKQLLGDPDVADPQKKRQVWFTHPDQAEAARVAIYGTRDVKSLPARLALSAKQDEIDAELRHSRQSTLVRHSLKESTAPKKFEKMTHENFDGDITVKRGSVQRQLPKGRTE